MEINGLSNVSMMQLTTPKTPTVAETTKSFGDYLSNALDNVNEAQVTSDKLTQQFAAGQVQDVHQVTIAGQKATILLQLTTQVRNKVIESYQEIMRMPL
ncbi:flagellar hook-basal body complex protein FliE [Brevibacillus fluminis]|uniref:Flagellar hook-basal body complex protein FliE n=1 Tax=Brevibacillus fluminis TaxID=511487 RepID=A0A3M8DXC4_9BACL|nr:flagellar hook-basal body complex protein FliE [Brevibacillus fluminis]RNB91881.1 flagellar hook-basal body complex protein FliE [Brevibacillus fluminis]